MSHIKWEMKSVRNGYVVKLYNKYAEEKKDQVVIEEIDDEHKMFEHIVGLMLEEFGPSDYGKFEQKNYRSVWVPGTDACVIEDQEQIVDMMELAEEILSRINKHIDSVIDKDAYMQTLDKDGWPVKNKIKKKTIKPESVLPKREYGDNELFMKLLNTYKKHNDEKWGK